VEQEYKIMITRISSYLNIGQLVQKYLTNNESCNLKLWNFGSKKNTFVSAEISSFLEFKDYFSNWYI